MPANLYMNLSSVQSFESVLVSVYYTKYNLSCGDHTRQNAVCCDDHPLQNGLSRDWNWKLIILVSKQHKYIHCCNPSHGLLHGKKKRKKINKSKDVLALGTSWQNIVIKFNSGEGWSHMLEEWITKKNQTMLFR